MSLKYTGAFRGPAPEFEIIIISSVSYRGLPNSLSFGTSIKHRLVPFKMLLRSSSNFSHPMTFSEIGRLEETDKAEWQRKKKGKD